MIASRAATAGAARVPAAHDDDGAAAAAPDEPVDLGGGSLGFAGGGGASYSLLHIHTLSLIALFDVLLRLFFFLFGVDHFLFPRLIARPQCGELPCCCARTGAHSAVPYADWCSFTTRQRVLFLTFALAGSSTRASPQRLHHPHPAAAAAASAMFQGRGVTAEDVVDPLAHWIPGSKREYIMDTEDEVRARPDRPTRQKILRGHFSSRLTTGVFLVDLAHLRQRPIPFRSGMLCCSLVVCCGTCDSFSGRNCSPPARRTLTA